MRYLVELSGSIELEASDAFEAEDLAMDILHGEYHVPVEFRTQDIDINFTVIDTREVDN